MSSSKLGLLFIKLSASLRSKITINLYYLCVFSLYSNHLSNVTHNQSCQFSSVMHVININRQKQKMFRFSKLTLTTAFLQFMQLIHFTKNIMLDGKDIPFKDIPTNEGCSMSLMNSIQNHD